jgi:GNAT superfamily N-acetyltransferase
MDKLCKLKSSDHEAYLVQCSSTLVSDDILDAMYEFITILDKIRECRPETTLNGAKAKIFEMIRLLTVIALKATHTVYWTENAEKMRNQFLCMLKTQHHMISICTDQAKMDMESEEELQGAAACTSDFSLKNLCRQNPQIYEHYILNLNNLITYFEDFQQSPKFGIATQAILIGKQACALLNNLYLMIDDRAMAVVSRRQLSYFTFHILIKPVILKERYISRIIRQSDIEGQLNIIKGLPKTDWVRWNDAYLTRSNDIRQMIMDHLESSWYQSKSDILRLREYTIFTVDNFLDNLRDGSDPICAFALLNHDVTRRWVPPAPGPFTEFSEPYVVIEHINVRPAYQRCGVASMLVRFIAQTAAKNGYERLSIQDTGAVSTTHHFWQCLGFRPSRKLWGRRDLVLKRKMTLKKEQTAPDRRTPSPLLHLRVCIETPSETPDAIP